MKICDELKILRKNYWKLEGSSLNSVEIKSISKPTAEFSNEKILTNLANIIKSKYGSDFRKHIK